VTVAGVRDGFVANEVWVVKTEGPTEGWTVLHKVSLGTGGGAKA